MPTDTRPEASDVAVARVSQAVRMRGRAAVQVVRAGQLVRVVSPVGVSVQAAGRGADLLRVRPVWRVSLRQRMPEAPVTRVHDPDDQRGPRVLVAPVARQRTDHQEGRAVHAAKENRVGKVAQGLKETQESQGQAPRGTIGSQKAPRHMNPDWALPSHREATVSHGSG